MKKDLFIKILKYTGVALIGAFVGIGVLAGVSSCHTTNKTPKTQLVRHQKKITATSDIFHSDKTYYFVAKNYEQSGEGVFYQDSISLTNSAICERYGASINTDTNITDVAFTLIRNSHLFKTYLRFSTSLDGGVYKLQTIYFQFNGRDTEYLYNTSNGTFSREKCAFTGRGFYNQYNDDSIALSYFNNFFDIYELSAYSLEYDFNNAFNFNNFYQVNNTFYAQPYSPVVGATTTTSGWEKTYSTGWFYSGGLVFNSIKVTFGRNLGYYFETAPNSNEYLQFPTNVANSSNYYFLQMEYINTATNFTITACNRTSYSKNGSSYIQFLPAWSNQSFKNLQFQDEINNLFVIQIFNSLSDTEQLNEPVITSNVGLSNVFSLLSMAFTVWLPIMNISIVPGITIGLLLFMPLVVGIIILVIWIVKR